MTRLPRLRELRDKHPLLLPMAFILVVVSGDLALDKDLGVFSPTLVLAAPLAALAARPKGVLLVGLVALTVRGGLAFREGQLDGRSAVYVGILTSSLVITLFSMYTARLRIRQARRLADVTSTAEAVQQAVLSPPAPCVGGVHVALRYVSASAAARIGGDLYEVLDTPFGTRVLVGDVQGKGLKAVSTGARVLGSFREVAEYEPRLTTVAERADTAVRNHVTPGGFVTGQLIEFTPSGPIRLVNCGHPPPLTIGSDGVVRELRPPDTGPPLGLGDLVDTRAHSWTAPLADDDILILYTDGVTEARGHDDTFYPLLERVGAILAGADPCPGVRDDTAVDDLDAKAGAIFADLLVHAGGSLDDDALILLLSRGRGHVTPGR